MIEHYGWLVAAMALAGLQAVMIAALLVERTRRRETQNRNAAMLRAMPDLMFVQSREGTYLDYHAADEDRLAATPAEFLGRHMRDVLPPDVVAAIAAPFDRVWTTDEPVVAEYTLDIGGSTGRYEARMVRCNPDRVLTIVRDITERGRAQAALAASEQRYAMATAAGRVGVWDWNRQSGEVYVDARLKALLGFADHEIGNCPDEWLRLVHPDDASLVAMGVRGIVTGETPEYEVVCRLIHKDGSTRWFLVRGSVVDVHGRSARIVGTGTEITERKEADEALRNAQGELERMSRLAALGEFAASIAHEVSQPLTTVMINARVGQRLLADGGRDIEGARQALSEVVDAASRATLVVGRNRELFTNHSVDRRPVDVNDAIHQAAQLAGTRLRSARVRLDVRAATGLPLVMADHIELCQVLLNLIDNAIDAIEETHGSSRIVTVASELAEDGQVQVSVSDTGIGLAGVDARQMFMPVYTTKPKGMGVGLSISRTVVEAHGGQIDAHANDGPGATLRFTLPTQSPD